MNALGGAGNALGGALLGRAAANIAALVGSPPAGAVAVVHSAGKAALGQAVAEALEGARQRVDLLSPSPGASPGAGATPAPDARGLAARLAAGQGLVLLLEPPQAPLLFALLGRPDRAPGLPVAPPPHLFCDWLLSPEGVVRVWSVDLDEVAAFRQRLVARLAGARTLRLTTPAGTDLTLSPRGWLAWPSPVGEVFTAPVEESVAGTLVIDGVAYSGPLARPIVLSVRAGRLRGLEGLDPADPLERLILADLTRDGNASRVAELGLGINPAARPSADIMEAEQARGTCHLGLGRNIAYGGRLESATHVDYTLLRPTLHADGALLCHDGRYHL